MLTRRLTGLARAGVILGFAATAALVTPGIASAALKVRVTHIPDTFALNDTVADGDVDDGAGGAGAVSLSQDNGGGGTETVVATGIGKPIHDTTLDLNAIVHSQVAETIILELTDTDYPATLGIGHLIGNVGGTTQGSVSFKACVDPGNVEFGTGGTCITQGPFTHVSGPALAFSDSASASHGALPMYSFTLIATIVHAAGDLTSFNYQADAVPEPSQVVLFGAGVLGLAYIAMRRRQAMNF
jgi:hypothetical protein